MLDDVKNQQNTAEPKSDAVEKTGASSTELVGRVAAPFGLEATSKDFHFWVKRGQLIEENQFVFTESEVGGERVKFYGVIDLLKRGSRKPTMSEEFDTFDGDVNFEPAFKSEGITSARVQILATAPEFDLPPMEQSPVSLGGANEAAVAYGFDDPKKPWMPIGLLKNGAGFAGRGMIDLDYLLGENGGHLNVNGIAGVGTKTTFLLTILKLLQREAEKSLKTNKPFFVVPIILNVKGEDLMWLDKWNNRFSEKDAAEWRQLDVESQPFAKTTFYAPQGKPVDGCSTTEYSWSFHDVLKENLLLFIFSDEDELNANMESLVRELAARFTKETKDGTVVDTDAPKTWNDFLAWMGNDTNIIKQYSGSWWAVYRRLFRVLEAGKDVFVRDEINGKPLKVTKTTTSPPQVVDINTLPQSLQRFVVGSILNQVVEARKSAKAVRGLRYLIMLDELNRFAPKGSRDEITRLLEKVASEMRSQGVILLGAQQMASQVSTKVIEMSSIRVLGRTGSAELTDKVWSGFEQTAREKAKKLQASEKLVMQPTFRQPMLIKMPMNPWADKRDNILYNRDEKELEKGI
ncbi:MAG TPA: ATP-binding protein [Pyrinomonadaceae bacterium]|jgi:hypothetical protein